MDEIKDLINLICKDELYDARNKLDVIIKQNIDDYKGDISKKVDIFKKES